MIINKAFLKSDEGKIIAIYEKDDNSYDLSISGKIKRVYAWDIDGNPIESDFFADVTVKWDSCSHYYFLGDKPQSNESYYHICGIYDYIEFMQILVFAYEIMVKQVGYEKIDEQKELRILRNLNLLKGCELIFE